MRNEPSNRTGTTAPASSGTLLAGGSFIAALAAGSASAACCVLPLALTVAGLGGAWLAHSTLLVRLEPYLVGFAGLSVAAAWLWLVRQWLRPAACARPGRPGWPLVALLGLATAATALALARPLWEGPAMQAFRALRIGR